MKDEKNPIRAVIFDLGGVLLRTEDQTPRRRWEARLGLGAGEVERAVFGCAMSELAAVGQATADQVWQSVNARFGFSDGDAEKFRADFFAGDVLDATLAQFLHDLRPRYKTAILSNAWLDLRRMLTERFHLVDTVDTIVISAEEGMVKPDARIYQIAATRLGVMPHEAIFVDDFVENVRGAQAVGMRGIHFKNAAQAMADVTEMLANS